MTVTSLDPDAVELPVVPAGPWTTPRGIRALATASMLLALVFAVIAELGVGGLRGAFAGIGHRSAPQVVATSDLYFALNDMDAQVAGVLLNGRSQAMTAYAQRRAQADRDLQRASAIAGRDPEAAEALRSLLDGFGDYQALAAEAVLLNDRRPHPAGRPPAEALARYRQATDLMKQRVLPAAERLRAASADSLERTYGHQRTAAQCMVILSVLTGTSVAAVLIALQVYLARRLRRRTNPLLALATAGVLALAGATAAMFATEAEHLRTAKEDAFDSVLALSRARAIGHDANADEIRFVVDPARRAQYQDAFSAKSQQLQRLIGIELGNITFTGERAAAESAASALTVYQHSDGRVRRRVAMGLAPGSAGREFDQYDQALVRVTEINQRAFDRSIRSGEDGLSGWTWGPPMALLLVAGLVLLAVRPRLSEYR
jgi:CHASE3 domain sensor protein